MGMICHLYPVKAEDARRLLEALDQAEDVGPLLDAGGYTSLEKSWHGLHFTLTGEEWGEDGPRAFLLAGGEPVGDDLGYGPGRLLEPEEVAQVANALAAITDAEFAQRFDVQQLADREIYPQIWDEDPAALLDEYRSYFHQMRTFMHEAARRGDGVLVVIS